MTSKVGSKEDSPTTPVNKQVLVRTSPVSSLLELEGKSLFHLNSALWILSSPIWLCILVFCILRILDKSPYSVQLGRKHTIPCVWEQLLRNSSYLSTLGIWAKIGSTWSKTLSSPTSKKLLLPMYITTTDHDLVPFGKWVNFWIIWNCSGHFGKTFT